MRNGRTSLDSTYVQLRFPVIQLVHLFAGLDGPSPVSREGTTRDATADYRIPVNLGQ